MAEAESPHLAAIEVGAVGRAERDRCHPNVLQFLAQPVRNLEREVEAPCLGVRPHEEEDRRSEPVEASEALDRCAARLQQFGLGRMPVEVDRSRDDADPLCQRRSKPGRFFIRKIS